MKLVIIQTELREQQAQQQRGNNDKRCAGIILYQSRS